MIATELHTLVTPTSLSFCPSVSFFGLPACTPLPGTSSFGKRHATSEAPSSAAYQIPCHTSPCSVHIIKSHAQNVFHAAKAQPAHFDTIHCPTYQATCDGGSYSGAAAFKWNAGDAWTYGDEAFFDKAERIRVEARVLRAEVCWLHAARAAMVLCSY